MEQNSKIMIAGARGMVGSAVHRLLNYRKYTNILPVGRESANFTRQDDTLGLLKKAQPEYLIVAAAKVGGIVANSKFPANFLYDNLMIQANLIHGAYVIGVKKLLFIGSSCIYPKYASQPMKEEELLNGLLEPTNEAYAIAKIAGIKMCQAYSQQYGCSFFSLMPCNLYGFGDNFHLENSHVIPALIRKFHDAKAKKSETVTCWGSGRPKREFMFVDDLASAIIMAMENNPETSYLNVGTGQEVTIKELAKLIAEVIEFDGKILWNTTKPDGTPRKVLNSDRITSLGWHPRISLREGLIKTYEWFLKHQS